MTNPSAVLRATVNRMIAQGGEVVTERPNAVCRLNKDSGQYEAKAPDGTVLFQSDSLQAVYNFLMGR